MTRLLLLVALGATFTDGRGAVDFAATVVPVARLTIERDGDFVLVDALQTGVDYRHDRETHYVGRGPVHVAMVPGGVRVTGHLLPRLLAGR